jgi:hypothetical protein
MSLQKESEWEEIDEKVYSILCGGIISIVETTEGKRIVGIASASEVITELIKELLSNREKEIAEEVIQAVAFFGMMAAVSWAVLH